MDNLFIRVRHANWKGGVSNLQVAEVYKVTSKGDMTIKIFTSLKAKAIDRAKAFIKKLTK